MRRRRARGSTAGLDWAGRGGEVRDMATGVAGGPGCSWPRLLRTRSNQCSSCSKRLEAVGGIDGVLAWDDCRERSVETERGEEAQDASGVAGEH